MTSDLVNSPEYRTTIARLEAAKRTTANGSVYWLAREIHTLLGYPVWDKFEPVVERAREAFRNNGIDPSHQIARTSKMMEVGKGARREGTDYFLSRPACSLIAMNGDPSKPEIAACQAYFVVQTRRMELEDQLSDDERRLMLRERVAKSFKAVSGVAKSAGVRNNMQPLFHDARSQGLYLMSSQAIKTRKGLPSDANLFDHAGPLELSANEFQMNLASEVIVKEGVMGEQAAIRKNREIASDVRNTMLRRGATPPEDLPSMSRYLKSGSGLSASTKRRRRFASRPSIGCAANLLRFLTLYRLEDRRAKPRRIATAKPKRLSEHARLVAPTRVGGVKAIVFQFAEIKNSAKCPREAGVAVGHRRHRRLALLAYAIV